MGINGLLAHLKPHLKTVTLRDLQNKVIGIDGYDWLYKGAYVDPVKIVKGIPTSVHVDYCMRKIDLLFQNNILPLFVFDGGALPMKKITDDRRKEQLKKLGLNDNMSKSEMFKEYAKCLSINHFHAHDLIKVLRVHKIPFIVAPYEADAQLSYLNKNGLVDAILYKFNNEYAQYLDCDEILKSLNLSPTQLLTSCVLSGCDYLESLHGIGLSKAMKLVRKAESESVDEILNLLERTRLIPTEYRTKIFEAIFTFRHQRIFCPKLNRLSYLNPINRAELTDKLNYVIGP
ncbi:PIN domain-like protein [Rozella allomycis CSF55]|uniref:PIN domain-like protein n=1 Tax=Rozella allomycis (strain CSF55) TaxID=988480 RepID=A0A4P9YFU7_ROZAC|nr:PIN domain-like protein [Rozella allomycis CSF55]